MHIQKHKFQIAILLVFVISSFANIDPSQAAQLPEEMQENIPLTPVVEEVAEMQINDECEPPTTSNPLAWWSRELVNESGRKTDSGTITGLTSGPAKVSVEAHSDSEYGCGTDQSDETFWVGLNKQAVTVTHDGSVGFAIKSVMIGADGKLNISSIAKGRPGSGFVYVQIVEQYKPCSELGNPVYGEWSDWKLDPETGDEFRTRTITYNDKYNASISCEAEAETEWREVTLPTPPEGHIVHVEDLPRFVTISQANAGICILTTKPGGGFRLERGGKNFIHFVRTSFSYWGEISNEKGKEVKVWNTCFSSVETLIDEDAGNYKARGMKNDKSHLITGRTMTISLILDEDWDDWMSKTQDFTEPEGQ